MSQSTDVDAECLLPQALEFEEPTADVYFHLAEPHGLPEHRHFGLAPNDPEGSRPVAALAAAGDS